MQPYSLDWPWARRHASSSRGGGGGQGRAPQTPGSVLDLFAGAATGVAVHAAGGEVRQTGWDAPAMGYFRDGGTQPWVHKREVFIAYEAWARAKGVATGMIR